MDNTPKKVGPEDVCAAFDRVPYSLIEEPEVCEWCSYYDDGLCRYSGDN
jgi:hypothetical protein